MSDEELEVGRFATAFKAFIDAMTTRALAEAPPRNHLLERIRAHMGHGATRLPIMDQQFDSFEQPNVHLALEAYLREPGREGELLGIGTQNRSYQQLSLADVLMTGNWLDEGSVEYVNYRLAHGQVLACLHLGLYLLRDGDQRLVVLVSGPRRMAGQPQLRVDVMASDAAGSQAFLAELTETMRRLNVYRGQVISLAPGQLGMGPQTLIAFHDLPSVRREHIVLPSGILERIERQTYVFSQHSDRLRAAGRSLKRGMLLFGPPGIGKTLTIMYLAGHMPGRTVLLTTGRGMGMITTIVQLARALAPAMVVIEDVDLIALDRGDPHMQTGPVLFELLNEMDGLADDSDVIFVLTTNRPDALEPALAARPGRIDLAVELALPDAASRRRLLDLYARGLELHEVDLDALASRTEGASPAYIKELLRKAAVIAFESASTPRVTQADINRAMAELAEAGRLGERIVGLYRTDAGGSADRAAAPRPAAVGFPVSVA